MQTMKRSLPQVFIALAILCGVTTFPSYSLEKKIPNCPEFLKVGIKFTPEGSENWRLIITESRSLRNQSLTQAIAILKLDVIEKINYWIGPTDYSKTSFEGGSKIIETADMSWNKMKNYIASMEDLGTCFGKNKKSIYFTGGLRSQSLIRVSKLIDFDKAKNELMSLIPDDDDYNDEKVRQYIKCDDAECIRRIIKSVEKKIGIN